MTQNQIKQFFKCTNFMSPTIIKYDEIIEGTLFVELSKGSFLSSFIYGVTLADRNGLIKDERDQSFLSLQEAETYINTLKGL